MADGDITTADISSALSAAEGAPPVSSDSAPMGTATTQPAATDASVPLAEPPQDKWPTILDNARKKATDEAWKGYEPLRGIPAERVNDLITWWQKAQANPDEFLTNALLEQRDPMDLIDKIMQKVQTHPTHSQSLKSFIGRRMAAMRGQQPEAEPQFLIPQPDGTIAVDMAALPKWQEWNRKQAVAAVTGEIQPIKDWYQTQQQQQEQLAEQRRIDTFADTTHQDFQTWPGMDDDGIRQEVVADFAAHIDGKTLNQEELRLELNAAHRRVFYPKVSQAERTRVVRDIHQTASAGTVNPSRSSTGAPKSREQMSIRELIEHELAG